MNAEKQEKPNVIAIMILATVLLASAAALTISTITTQDVYAYESNQASTGTNACGNGENPFNILCQNLLSQIEGDGNAVNIIGLQTGGERTTTTPPEETATLIVKKIVECAEGRECPGLPEPEEFLITVTTSNNPQPESVEGSTEGIPIPLTLGEYSTDETRPEDPEGLFFVESEFSTDCSSGLNGPILAGDERECTITNTYAPDTIAVLKVILNVECVPEEECPGLPVPADFSIRISGNNPVPSNFPGSATGTLVTLNPGGYIPTIVLQSGTPAGLQFVSFTFSNECSSTTSGSIQAGEVRTCTMQATFAPV
jgi:hypothetical protein